MDNLEKLIARKLAGEEDEQDKEALEKWLNQSEENKQVYSELIKYWNIKTNNKDRNRKLWEKVSERINEPENLRNGKTGTIQQKAKWFDPYFVKVAASFLIIVVSVFTFYKLNTEVEQEVKPGTEEVMVEKLIPKGQKSTLTLQDGSVVIVNSGSKFSFKEKFSADQRLVYLEGEAFFDIERDSLRPFIIKTGEITTTVLGTSFNVHAFPQDNKVHVSVVSGKVKVDINDPADKELNQDSYFLLPNEMLTRERNSGKITKSGYDYASVIGWKDGMIVFKMAESEEIIQTLSRWYGHDFVFKNGHKIKGKFTGTFKRQSLKTVLEAISIASDFDYKIEGNTVEINLN
ncbi:FecR family protein [Flexithrix dorotheae]|uniref:FecR family protein n=1 Tax=Flexithrix dorotheae TaxID=70993 RepID=UPI000378CD28|nr:FecR family protein [Flexithrix dorotheae]